MLVGNTTLSTPLAYVMDSPPCTRPMEEERMQAGESLVPDSRPLVPRQPRLPVVLAVELSSKAKPGRCGVTRNASGKGLLIVTPSRFSVGDEIDLAVHVGTRSGRASAKVVRVEENAKESCETW